MLAQIQKAMKGDTRAAEYIRDTSGNKMREGLLDYEEQQARIDKLRAETARIKGEDMGDNAQDDGFIEALRGAVDVWQE
jgi:phage terminase small subunit